jgi:hypothetical protein
LKNSATSFKSTNALWDRFLGQIFLLNTQHNFVVYAFSTQGPFFYPNSSFFQLIFIIPKFFTVYCFCVEGDIGALFR